MPEWFISVEPEGWAAIAAAAIATISLMLQASSQRRQTRLILLDHRLKVFRELSELCASAGHIAINTQHNAMLEDALRPLDEEVRGAFGDLSIPIGSELHDRLDEQLRKAVGAFYSAEVLFGDELIPVTRALYREVLGTVSALREHDIGELRKREDGLLKTRIELHRLMKPYIAKEKRAGLTFMDRLPARTFQDPLMSPSPPMNQPRRGGQGSGLS